MHDHKTALRLLAVCALVLAFLSGLSMLKDKSEVDTSRLTTRTLRQQAAALPAFATITTDAGEIVVKLLGDTTPLAVANFAKLAEQDFYNGTSFHRVIRGFMIQGGDPLSKQDDTSLWGKGGPGYTFADELSGSPMVRGVVAMANSGPNSNGSQFFIIVAAETPWLDGRHTIFGEVVSGMDVADTISKAAVNNTKDNRPMKPVRIESISLK